MAPKTFALLLCLLCRSPLALALDGAPNSQNNRDKKWRDTGVYLDGKPLAMLSFGELPIALEPVWVREKVSTEIEPGKKGSGFKIVEQRRYRFVDYLRALGVDLRRVREIHVVGPRMSNTIIASGAELRSKKGRGFMFRFGAEVGGKAIPVVPSAFGNDYSPDKISAVMVYVDKRPPVLVPNEGLAIDGKLIEDVPYFGEPIRGGVRVYLDDRLSFSIKRPMLRDTPSTVSSDGKRHWTLWSVLEKQKLTVAPIVEAWVIRDERRVERLTRDQLEKIEFTVGEKEKSEIFLGESLARCQAIALHTRAIKSEELVRIREEEAQ